MHGQFKIGTYSAVFWSRIRILEDLLDPDGEVQTPFFLFEKFHV